MGCMRELTQTAVLLQPPTGRNRRFPWAGGRLWAGGLCAAALGLALAETASAQTFRMAGMDFDLMATAMLAYDSNVDDVYPDEEEPGRKTDDFYWVPKLSLQSRPVPLRPGTTYNLGAQVAYEDYFERNDLDTEIYDVVLNFQTAHPRLTLGGMGRIANEVEGIEDQYVPGQASRDPVLTTEGNVFANWNYRKVRLEAMAEYTEELHEKEEFQAGDQEEITLEAGAYWDVFSWGSLFYKLENTVTTLLQPETETDETIHTFGVDGAIPLSILRRPRITYAFGFSYEDEQTDATEEEDEPKWEPTHTIGVSDEYELSRSLNLSYSATWEDTWENDSPSFYLPGQKRDEEEDEVTFEYNVKLNHKLGARAEHSLTFSQEPESTFGSNSDTESTKFAYDFLYRDLVVYGLNFHASALYEMETPLGDEEAETEKTTTLTTGLSHVRQLSRRLNRILAYEYTWENSNFHDEGANEKHLATYSLTYTF